MITIQVMSKYDGKPIPNQRVAISYNGLLNGYVSSDVKTDGNGVAKIDVEHRENTQGKVFVNGRIVYEGYIEFFMNVSIDYP